MDHWSALDRHLADDLLCPEARRPNHRGVRWSLQGQRIFGVSSRWDCPAVQATDTLTVSGGYATFADLSGWVAPGGAAALSSQIARLKGQFQSGHFEGLLQFHERGSDRLTCGYTLKLDRAG